MMAAIVWKLGYVQHFHEKQMLWQQHCETLRSPLYPSWWSLYVNFLTWTFRVNAHSSTYVYISTYMYICIYAHVHMYRNFMIYNSLGLSHVLSCYELLCLSPATIIFENRLTSSEAHIDPPFEGAAARAPSSNTWRN